MFTTGAKYFFGVTFFALVAAFVWGFVTYGNGIGMATFTGVITLGFKGGVGQHLGYTLFVGLALVSLFLGITSSLFRDADPQAVAEVAAAPEVPVVAAPQGHSVWPAVAALSAGLIILGVVYLKGLVILGLVLAVAVAVELTVRAWSERATGDARVNRQIRNRIMYPLELPLLALFGIVFFAGGVSRLMLAVSENTSTLILALVPFVAMIAAVIVNSRPQITKSLARGVLTVGAVAVLALGVAGLVQGQHTVENKSNEGPHYVPDLPPGPIGNKPNIGLKVPEAGK